MPEARTSIDQSAPVESTIIEESPYAVTASAWQLAPRRWQMIISGLSCLLLLAVCGLTGYFLVAEEQQGYTTRTGGAVPTVAPRDISSRSVDPDPLTVAEVFPGTEIVIDDAPPYQVLRTQAGTDCTAAVTGDLRSLLSDLGCEQVVRATLRSPDDRYLLTAGVLNLADEAGTEWARKQIGTIVNAGEGRLRGLGAGTGTEAITGDEVQAGWHGRGHFLVYCVIARNDGGPIDKDPAARRALSEVVETYLRGQVIARRATEGFTPATAPTS